MPYLNLNRSYTKQADSNLSQSIEETPELEAILMILEEIHQFGPTPFRMEKLSDSYRAFRLNVGFVEFV